MATAKLLLDKSKANKSGYFSIRIQIYHQGKQYKFTTKLIASADQFNEAQSNKAKSKAVRLLRKQMDEVRLKADQVCERLGSCFTSEKFKRLFYSDIQHTTKSQLLDLRDLYSDYMNLLVNNHHSPKTIKYHNSAMKCFIKYQPGICLQHVTTEWLNGFEKYMLGKGNSLTGIGTYVRSLRTIYNKAVEDGLIGRDNIPFGKRKYLIAAAVSAKSFLFPDELLRFKEYQAQSEAQQRAKDYWFFMYYLNGIGPTDALQLSHKSISGTNIIFHRQKTAKSRTESKPIVAHMHEEVRNILQRQGCETPNTYLFPVLQAGMSAEQRVEAIDTWKRLTNRVLNRISTRLNFHIKLNLYSARHTWATVMKLNDVPIIDISDGLGHSRIGQTQNYMGSIITDKVKLLSDLL